MIGKKFDLCKNLKNKLSDLMKCSYFLAFFIEKIPLGDREEIFFIKKWWKTSTYKNGDHPTTYIT